MHLILFLSILVLFTTNSFGQKPADEKKNTNNVKNADVLQIREVFRQINEFKNYRIVTIDDSEAFLGNVTDNGGSLTGYYKEDTLKKIVEWVGLSNRVIQNEYYFDNGKLVFVYAVERQYSLKSTSLESDFTKLNKTFEGRYYFNNNKLFKTVLHGKVTEETQDFLSSSKEYVKLLTDQTAIHQTSSIQTTEKSTVQLQKESVKKGESIAEHSDTAKTYPYMLEYKTGQRTTAIPITILNIKYQQLNPYFYETSVLTQTFNVFKYNDEEEVRMARQITLNIFPIIETKNGVVYDLVLHNNKKVGIPAGELNLGFFYVQKRNITECAPTKENYQSLINGVVPRSSVVVAETSPSKGAHETKFIQEIKLANDSCMFGLYDDSWSERIVWKKNKGIIQYFRGFGDRTDAISLALPPNQPE